MPRLRQKAVDVNSQGAPAMQHCRGDPGFTAFFDQLLQTQLQEILVSSVLLTEALWQKFKATDCGFDFSEALKIRQTVYLAR